METKIVTWLGGGQECTHFEGEAVRVSVDGDADIRIEQVSMRDGKLHILVYPLRAEFDIIDVLPIKSRPTWHMLLLTKGPSRNIGKRPIYDAVTEKVVGQM